ncbi:MAG: hypothetical protein RL662_1769, partial [Bacteroidota bacterium]
MKKTIYILIALVMSVSLHAQIDRSKTPKSGPTPTINLQEADSFELPNGLKVFVVENHKLPRVTFTLSLDNPPIFKGNIKGIDHITSSMLGKGTTKIAKDEYNEQLDFYGASINFSVHNTSGAILSKYFSDVLELVAQGVLDPLFSYEELDSERAKLLDAIKANEKSTEAIASRVKDVLLYGKNHPKGEYISEETINNITFDDVKNYYKTYFVPENAYLVIVGDVNLDKVKKMVTENFASWQSGVAPKAVYEVAPSVSKTEIDFVDVPNAVQSQILISNTVNLKITDSDYFAAILANYILGGASDSYLFKSLREKHAWTYGAYSSIAGDKYTGDFVASAAVRNAVTDSAVVEMLKEIKKIRTKLPTSAELSLAKAKYIGAFVMQAQNPQTIARFALRQRTQRLTPDFYQNYIKSFTAVTLEQVRAAAQKYFSNDPTRIII